jgi:AcrR family transcriptional regulator
MALFAAKGFDEVTISQVADAAGVSKMTVTNYFPRKEDLVFDRAEVIIRSLADAAAARAAAARHAFDLLEPSLGGYGILLGWLEAIFAV